MRKMIVGSLLAIMAFSMNAQTDISLFWRSDSVQVSEIFSPEGDLYPCHQFVGEEKFKLGDIWNGVTNTKTQNEFAACNVYTRPECVDCWARLYCSGGCAANAYHATGSVNGIYKYGCELFKKRMECAIMLEIAKNMDEEVQKELIDKKAKPIRTVSLVFSFIFILL